jgi:hypothetical protein
MDGFKPMYVQKAPPPKLHNPAPKTSNDKAIGESNKTVSAVGTSQLAPISQPTVQVSSKSSVGDMALRTPFISNMSSNSKLSKVEKLNTTILSKTDADAETMKTYSSC